MGADRIIYQDLDDLKAAVHKANTNINNFDASCFDGVYITGDISADYLNKVEAMRGSGESQTLIDDDQLELNLAVSASSM